MSENNFKHGLIPIYSDTGYGTTKISYPIAYASQVLIAAQEYGMPYLFIDCYGYKSVLQKIKAVYGKNYNYNTFAFKNLTIKLTNYPGIIDYNNQREIPITNYGLHTVFNCNVQKINKSDVHKLTAYYSEEKYKNSLNTSLINTDNDSISGTTKHVIYVPLSSLSDVIPNDSGIAINNTENVVSLLKRSSVVRHEIFKCLKENLTTPILEEWVPFLLERISGTFSTPVVDISPCKAYYADYNDPNNIYAFLVKIDDYRRIETAISIGLSERAITIRQLPKASEKISKITNLNEYLENFSDQLISKVSEKFNAVFDPNKEDYNQREKDFFEYSEYYGKLKFFEAQKNVIAAVNRNLKKQRSAFIVGEMGCGKTALSIGATYANADKDNVTNIVMCPGHLVEKWKREIERIYPFARAAIITSFESLSELDKEIRNPKRKYPLFLVISKDTAKIDYTERPAVSWHKRKEYFYLGEDGDKIDSYSRNITTLHQSRDRDGNVYDNRINYFVESVEHLCSLFLNKMTKNAYINNSSSSRAPLYTCPNRKNYEKRQKGLWTVANNRSKNDWIKTSMGWLNKNMFPLIKEAYALNPHRQVIKKLYNTVMDIEINGVPVQVMPRRYSLAKYIRKTYGRIIDYFIADEVHLYSSSTSAQANAFGDLVRSAKKTIALTGTLLNGYADGIYYILFRMYSKKFSKDGYNYSKVDNFVNRYGVKRTTETVEIDTRMWRNSKVTKKVMPGVSPKLFTEFLLDKAIFISLSDMSNALPKYTEHPVPVELGEEEQKLYTESASKISELLKAQNPDYNINEIAFQAAQRLNIYPDQPYDVAPICSKNNKVLHEFKDLCVDDEQKTYVSNKDQKVLDIVQEKLEKGENVLIYVNYVNKTECVERLERIFNEFKIKTCVLDTNVSASKREEWIDKKIKAGYRVMICNPTLVETGLDLLAFTNIIFYQVGYNLFTMRQASRRSLRLNQPNDVNVYFLYYSGTTQEAVLSLMANKLQAAMAIEGKFTEEGLNAMSNNDSILTQIAESLVQNIEHKIEMGSFSSGIGKAEDDDGSRFKLIDMISSWDKKAPTYSLFKNNNKKSVLNIDLGISNKNLRLTV